MQRPPLSSRRQPKSAAPSPSALPTSRPPCAPTAATSAFAFQLVDDALDYSGDSTSLGKSVGDDFREGKITLPVILSFRRGTSRDREFWNRTIVSGELGDGDLEHAIGLMRQHKTIDSTLERARSYGAIAHDALEIFPPSREKSAMQDVIGFCISRAH